MRKGGASKGGASFCHPRVLRASTQTFCKRGGVFVDD